MSHYSLDELIEFWKHEKLTVEQIIGQMLQVLREHERRLRERPTAGPPGEGRPGK
jgi:hypothetical protein